MEIKTWKYLRSSTSKLPNIQKCRALLWGLGNQGLVLCQVLNLQPNKMKVDNTWNKWEEFYKTQKITSGSGKTCFNIFHRKCKYWRTEGKVKKYLTLCVYMTETCNILTRDICLFGTEEQDFLAKCLSEASTEWTVTCIRYIAKSLRVLKIRPIIWILVLSCH